MKRVTSDGIFADPGGPISPTMGAVQCMTTNIHQHLGAVEYRGRRRVKRLLLAGGSTVFSKAVALGVTLMSVPLALGYLGVERYGMWMAITASLSFLTFADFGVGNGLINVLSAADGRSDPRSASVAVSSGFFMLLLLAALLSTAFGLIYPLIPWGSLLNVTSPVAKREAGPCAAVFFACFALNLPLGIIQRIQLAYQEGMFSNLWQSFGSLLGLGALVLGIRAGYELPVLVGCVAGGPVIANLLSSIVEFKSIRPWLRPRLHLVDFHVARSLFLIGGAFLIYSIGQVVAYQLDSFLIARFSGSAAVATYAVTQKLFLITSLVSFLCVPLWPAFGEALSRGDYQWAKQSLNRFMIASVLVSIFLSSLLALFGQRITAQWSGATIVPSHSLLVAFGALSVMTAYISIISAFLNNQRTIRPHAMLFGASSLLALLLKVLFFPILGQPGLIWATTLAFAVGYVWPARQLVCKAFTQLGDVRE